MSSRPRALQRKFFEGFSFGRFLVKSNGIFFGFLGGAAAFADWSFWAEELQSAVRAEKFAIFIVYAVWEGLFLAYEMLRLKLRYDLACVRSENNARRRARKGRK